MYLLLLLLLVLVLMLFVWFLLLLSLAVRIYDSVCPPLCKIVGATPPLVFVRLFDDIEGAWCVPPYCEAKYIVQFARACCLFILFSCGQ